MGTGSKKKLEKERLKGGSAARVGAPLPRTKKVGASYLQDKIGERKNNGG